jgi:PD-(D/E)XK endonuclease
VPADIVQLPVSFLVQDAPFEDEPSQTLEADSTPKKRNTKLVGDISEARVLMALTEAGYAISKPFGENVRYDLIADDGERLLRVQVKTGKLRNGAIRFNACSSHGHRNGGSRPYFGEIDYLAVYCPQNRKVYLLPETALVATHGHLRVAPAKNNMVKTIRWAEPFELA